MVDKKITADLSDNALFSRVADIIHSARTRIVQTVNQELVYAYWAIGREIVQELQGGDERAEYGKRVVRELSEKLTERFGKGYSVPNLWLFKQFFIAYSEAKEIPYTACRELQDSGNQLLGKVSTACSESFITFNPNLSWSHYRLLMRVENRNARSFYEKEAAENSWSVRQLERQISTIFYERLLKSSDKQGMLESVSSENTITRAIDVLKDPYVLEFLSLPESAQLQESELEMALIEHLQNFLLELGGGSAFVGRQKRITLEGEHFYPDLVFYHIRLRCYVIIDLKVDKLKHGDIGQMQLYVRYYDKDVKQEGDNATLGLILCSDKNESVVKYVLGEENQQIFASRYKLELPDEEVLRQELNRERQFIEERQKNDHE